MKMHQLPKSRMAGVKDRLVNVPVHENDVINTVNSLPRTPHEAGIIPVKLKRTVEYKNTHKEEYVSVPKIKAALKTLKTLGHKYYQFIDELEVDNYESRCKDLDKDQIEFLAELHSVVTVLEDLLVLLGFHFLLRHFLLGVDPFLPVHNTRLNEIHQLEKHQAIVNVRV